MYDTDVHSKSVRSDDIGAAAKECLRASPYKAFAGVSCQCEHGVLLLKGQVSSFYHKQVAQEAVARVSGVTQVDNEIDVGYPVKRDRSPTSTAQPAESGLPGASPSVSGRPAPHDLAHRIPGRQR
ncbi:MAG: BON domain-containing protein [Candidatus Nealsonbacteria bacterium]|nr:BON domain-containing protein [Candidatus Nealsonbacteria bacterium]